MKEQTVTFLHLATVILGGVLINIPLGVINYYGNLSTYIDSYYIAAVGKDKHTTGSLWLVTVWLSCMAVGITISGAVSGRVGARLTLLGGIILFNASVYLSYFTLRSSFWSLHITMGIASGVGCGISYAMTLVYTTTWIKKRIGLASAIVSSAMGGGSIVFNLATTFYINPENAEPDINVGESRYFSSDDIINRVPNVFFVLGALTTGCHVIAFPLMRNHHDLPHLRELKTSANKSILRDNSCANKTDSNSKDIGHYGTTESSDMSGMNTVHEEQCILDKEQTNRNNSPSTSKDETTRISSTPLQALCTKTFYLLSVSQAFFTIGFIIENGSYKQFGVLYISDDILLANIGVGINVASCLGRIAWGLTLDKFNINSVLVLMTSSHAILSAFWYFTPRANQWLYTIFSMALMVNQSGGYIVYPIAVLKLYGPDYYMFIYGMMSFSRIIVYCTVPAVADLILFQLGWFWLFFFVSVSSLIALIPHTFLR